MTDPRTMTDRELVDFQPCTTREQRAATENEIFRRFGIYVEDGRVLPGGWSVQRADTDNSFILEDPNGHIHAVSATPRVPEPTASEQPCPCAARLDRLERAMRKWGDGDRVSASRHLARMAAEALTPGEQE